MWKFETANIGDEIPSLTLPPINRATLALYAGASGDHNPAHIDSKFAQNAGMPDVFAHGMLVMAYLGRALTNAVPQSLIQKFGVRFSSITEVENILTCKGVVSNIKQQNDTVKLTLELFVSDEADDIKLHGHAVI